MGAILPNVTEGKCSRRGVLQFAAGACAVGILPAGVVSAETPTDVLRFNITRCFAREDAMAIGSQVVGAGLAPQHTGDIATALISRLEQAIWLDTSTKRKHLVKDLEARIREDFGEGSVVLVEGWMLSQTEALATALIAQSQAQRPASD